MLMLAPGSGRWGVIERMTGVMASSITMITKVVSVLPAVFVTVTRTREDWIGVVSDTATVAL